MNAVAETSLNRLLSELHLGLYGRNQCELVKSRALPCLAGLGGRNQNESALLKQKKHLTFHQFETSVPSSSNYVSYSVTHRGVILEEVRIFCCRLHWHTPPPSPATIAGMSTFLPSLLAFLFSQCSRWRRLS